MDSGPHHAAFLSKLSKLDSAVLYRHRDNVEALMEHPGWVFVQELLDGGAAAIQHLMTYRVMESQADYAWHAGKIAGLEQMRVAAESVLIAADKKKQKLEAPADAEGIEA